MTKYLASALFMFILMTNEGFPETEANHAVLKIYLQSSFKNDNVKVMLNKHVLINEENVKTVESLGFTGISKEKNVLKKKQYTIKLLVNDDVVFKQSLCIDENTHIGLNYIRYRKKGSMEIYNFPLLYD